MLKKLFYLSILFILLLFPGCSTNIKNIPADTGSADSIIVGHIETIPVLWEFCLYEENSQVEDRIDIAGQGFGISKGGKLQNQGYLFKVARPGIYIFRLKKVTKNKNDYDDILRFEVPMGKLVYFGTIRIVIDRIAPFSPGYGKSGKTPLAFRYHYERIDEEETLKHFAKLYPEAYSSYKDKIIRLPSSSQPTYETLLPSNGDNSLPHKLALRF